MVTEEELQAMKQVGWKVERKTRVRQITSIQRKKIKAEAAERAGDLRRAEWHRRRILGKACFSCGVELPLRRRGCKRLDIKGWICPTPACVADADKKGWRTPVATRDSKTKKAIAEASKSMSTRARILVQHESRRIGKRVDARLFKLGSEGIFDNRMIRLLKVEEDGSFTCELFTKVGKGAGLVHGISTGEVEILWYSDNREKQWKRFCQFFPGKSRSEIFIEILIGYRDRHRGRI